MKIWDLLPHNVQHLFLWVQISGSSINTSLGSAIRSDVTNASTAETFSINFTLSTSFAFAWFMTRFSEDFLAVSDFQAQKFYIFTFHSFVNAGMMIAIFITQISHHHWSKTAGTTVDDGHDVSLHLCIIREQMLLFSISVEAHGEKNGQSHVFRQLVSCAFSVALFQIFPSLNGV